MKILFLLQTPTPTAPPRPFEVGIVWQTLRDLGNGFLAPASVYRSRNHRFSGLSGYRQRIVKRIVHAAGERTRLDVTLADLLGRIASLVIILGVFVAAVVIFPAFKPGRFDYGFGHFVGRHRLHLQRRNAKLFRRNFDLMAAAVRRRRSTELPRLFRYSRRNQHSLDQN